MTAVYHYSSCARDEGIRLSEYLQTHNYDKVKSQMALDFYSKPLLTLFQNSPQECLDFLLPSLLQAIRQGSLPAVQYLLSPAITIRLCSQTLFIIWEITTIREQLFNLAIDSQRWSIIKWFLSITESSKPYSISLIQNLLNRLFSGPVESFRANRNCIVEPEWQNQRETLNLLLNLLSDLQGRDNVLHDLNIILQFNFLYCEYFLEHLLGADWVRSLLYGKLACQFNNEIVPMALLLNDGITAYLIRWYYFQNSTFFLQCEEAETRIVMDHNSVEESDAANNENVKQLLLLKQDYKIPEYEACIQYLVSNVGILPLDTTYCRALQNTFLFNYLLSEKVQLETDIARHFYIYDSLLFSIREECRLYELDDCSEKEIARIDEVVSIFMAFVRRYPHLPQGILREDRRESFRLQRWLNRKQAEQERKKQLQNIRREARLATLRSHRSRQISRAELWNNTTNSGNKEENVGTEEIIQCLREYNCDNHFDLITLEPFRLTDTLFFFIDKLEVAASCGGDEKEKEKEAVVKKKRRFTVYSKTSLIKSLDCSCYDGSNGKVYKLPLQEWIDESAYQLLKTTVNNDTLFEFLSLEPRYANKTPFFTLKIL